MNTLIQFKTFTLQFFTALALLCFGLLPKAQAVSPPPDGGYSGGNTAEGQGALLSLSSGNYNTAIGLFSLLSVTDGNFNTGVGAGTLLSDTGPENTATGAGALFSNTTGADNTADGVFALFTNTEGHDNTAIGDFVLFSNTAGSNNVAIGRQALYNNITGSQNTASGLFALQNDTDGSDNTAIGASSLVNNTGSGNTALGVNAGSNLTTGTNNIDIGLDVTGVAAESNTIRIGDTDITDAFIRGISGTTIASGDPVLVAANGHLGTLTSSKRFKHDIEPMDKASEVLFSLKPVSFRYKTEIDPAGTLQFGLIAEDVEKVNPELVTRDESGRVNSVRYDKVNAMLLNEFLKEHRKMEKLQNDFQTTVAQQQEEMRALTALLKEQAAQIEKLNAQVQVSKAAPQVVANQP